MGSVCPVCWTQFWTSWRLRRHLEKGSLRCALQVLAMEKPSEVELAEARGAEAAQRREFKKQGKDMDDAALPAMAMSAALLAMCGDQGEQTLV